MRDPEGDLESLCDPDGDLEPLLDPERDLDLIVGLSLDLCDPLLDLERELDLDLEERDCDLEHDADLDLAGDLKLLRSECGVPERFSECCDNDLERDLSLLLCLDSDFLDPDLDLGE